MSTPTTEDITRVQGDREPPETFTWPSDLTGHTAHLLIVTSARTTVDTIAGTVTPAATSSIEFAITAAAVATAGTYSYAVIFDMATAALKRTVQTGDWIVTDYPG